MSIETSRALVQRLFDEVVNTWDLEHLEELFTPEFRSDPDDDGDVTGPAAARGFLLWLRNAFPDLQYTIDDLVVEDDRAVARLHATATHGGDYLGRAASGARVRFTEIVMFRIVGGRIAEWWPHGDQLGIVEQIDAHLDASR